MRIWMPIILLPLLLGGCTTADLAKFLGFGSALSDAAMNYVKTDVIGKRILIRGECWELLQEEVQELREVGKRSEARKLLAQAYVPLTIIQAIEDGDTAAIVKELNQARPCLVGNHAPEALPAEAPHDSL